MKQFMGILNEVNRLEAISKSAVDTKTALAVKQAIYVLNWVLDVETDSPFEALGLEEGVQS